MEEISQGVYSSGRPLGKAYSNIYPPSEKFSSQEEDFCFFIVFSNYSKIEKRLGSTTHKQVAQLAEHQRKTNNPTASFITGENILRPRDKITFTGSPDGRRVIRRKVRASQGRIPGNARPEQSEGKRSRKYTAVNTATVKRRWVKARQSWSNS